MLHFRLPGALLAILILLGALAPPAGAQTSEAAAQTSEAAAQTSEAAAQTSEAAAQTSEAAAQTSEAAAQTSEAAAQTSEAAAQTSEAAAQTSEAAAQTSEAAAQTSEAAAQTSEAAAQTSEAAGEGTSAEAAPRGLPDVSAPATQLIEIPSRQALEDAIPEGTLLTGREIYERYLENRQLHSAIQHQKIISTDPGGSTQTSRFWVRWKDYTDEDDKPVDGVYAKTLMRFKEPFDMRNTGFLMIINEGGTNDQFVYRPSDRRVRRVNLSSGGVMGSDYTFDDIAFQNVDDAEYVRMADEVLQGVPVYVVEAKAKPTVHSKYHHTLNYIEQDHYIPLRTRYWDEDEVEVKELTAPHASIRQFGEVWVATESTMRNLQEDTVSQMFVEDLEPNPELADRLFSIFKLQVGR